MATNRTEYMRAYRAKHRERLNAQKTAWRRRVGRPYDPEIARIKREAKREKMGLKPRGTGDKYIRQICRELGIRYETPPPSVARSGEGVASGLGTSDRPCVSVE